MKDLIKIRRHLINLIILVSLWIASSFDFYLISFQLKYIKGDFFINTIVATIVEIPASIFSGIIYSKLGIRFVMISSFSVSIVGGILLVIFAD